MANDVPIQGLSNSEAAEFWASVYNKQQAGILILNNGIIKSSNDAAAKILGAASSDEIIGIPVVERFVMPEYQKRVQEKIDFLTSRACSNAVSVQPTEIRIQALDGEQKDILLSAASWSMQNEILVETTFFDVSIFKNRERLLAAITGLHALMISTDLSANFKDIEKGALKIMHQLYAEPHNCGFISFELDDYFLKESGTLISSLGPLVNSYEPLSAVSRQWFFEHSKELHDSSEANLSFRIPISDNTEGKLYCVPTIIEGKLYGLMFWLFPCKYASNIIDEDVERRKSFSQSAVVVISAYLSKRANIQHSSDLAILYRLSRELVVQQSLQAMAETVVQIIEQEKGWRPSAIRIQSRPGAPLQTVAYRTSIQGDDKETEKKKEFYDTHADQIGKGITNLIVEQGKQVRVLDLPANPHYLEIEPGMKYGIFAPIPIDGIVEGAIAVESSDYVFTDSDLQLLTSMGEVIGYTIKSIRLIELLKERLHWLEIVHSINRQIGTNTNAQELYQILIESLLTATRAESVSLLIYDPDTGFLKKAIARGWMEGAFKMPISSSEGISGYVFRTGNTHIASRLSQDVLFLPWVRPFLPEESSSITVPVRSEEGILGVLHLAMKAQDFLTKEFIDFVEMFGSYCGIIIGRSEQVARLQEAKEQLQRAYDQTLEGWARALGVRDNETFEHTMRATEISLAIGEALGLDEKSLIDLKRGAILHDIGKIAIPDSVLRNEGELTEQEREIMRTHPTFAYELLRPIDYLKDAIVVPYCHHEHWDGSGYPQGLKQKEIPLLARIFTLADVYDALLSDRPYRERWTKKEAFAYIRAQSGKIFDPHIVDIFFAIQDSLP